MRTTSILSGAAILACFTCLNADEQPVPKRAEPTAVQPAAKPTVKPVAAKPVADAPEKAPRTKQTIADEEAIRQADAAFIAAYDQGDAAKVAAHFTDDAEFVDERGNVYHGRSAIETSLAEMFAENKDCRLELNIDTIRLLNSGLAIEDGTTIVSRPNSASTMESKYTTVHVKSGDKWLVASVRDHAPKDRRQHRAQLQQLDWMVGEWVDEGDEAVVTFSCQPVDSGNFLLRKFTMHVAGQEAMSGTQRIGWDPISGKLKAWIFDSEGAYGEGQWHRDGDDWVLKASGVLANGQTASSTSIYKFVNDHTMTWQSINHEIAGVKQPDSQILTIVRMAPAPTPVVADNAK